MPKTDQTVHLHEARTKEDTWKLAEQWWDASEALIPLLQSRFTPTESTLMLMMTCGRVLALSKTQDSGEEAFSDFIHAGEAMFTVGFECERLHSRKPEGHG